MNCLEQLQKLGLNGRQANVYLALLQLGSASAIELAKATGYKHPTVYDVLDSLKERQLISESFAGGKKRFAAEDPVKWEEFERERRQTLDLLLPDLKMLYDARENRPRVRFYQGEAGILEIHRQLLNAADKQYFYFGSVREMFQTTGADKLEEYYHERIRRGVRSYAIRVRSGENDIDYMQPGEHNLREVRYLPRPVSGEIAGLYLYDNTVAIVSALKENYSMTIESRELFTLLKTVWLCIWEIAEVGGSPEGGTWKNEEEQ